MKLTKFQVRTSWGVGQEPINKIMAKISMTKIQKETQRMISFVWTLGHYVENNSITPSPLVGEGGG